MINIAVCDDNKIELNTLKTLINTYSTEHKDTELNVSYYSKLKDLTDIYDIYLLDIILNKESGIEYAKSLRRKKINSPVIFLTTSQDYAIEAFNVDALSYLLKPVDPERFYGVLEHAIQELALDVPDIVSIQAVGGITNIYLRDLTFLETKNHRIYYHLQDKTVIQSSTIRVPFEEAAVSILNDIRFMQPHKSYIINMFAINRLLNQSVYVSTGEIIPIARSRYSQIKQQYMDFLSRY